MFPGRVDRQQFHISHRVTEPTDERADGGPDRASIVRSATG
jgi:hypothetical protein